MRHFQSRLWGHLFTLVGPSLCAVGLGLALWEGVSPPTAALYGFFFGLQCGFALWTLDLRLGE